MKNLIFILILILTAQSFAQNDTIDFESDAWNIDDSNARVSRYMGRKSLYLGGGYAYLKDLEFENGTIEVDIASHGNRGFAGVVFRWMSRDDHELFYVRPHKTRLLDALQYCPVFNGLSTWQLYSNEGFTAAAEIPHNRWMKLRIEVSGTRANFYLDGDSKPSLVVTDLKRGLSKGTIGLWGSGAAHFSNFRYSKTDPNIPGGRETIATPEGMITKWSLSKAFNVSEMNPGVLPAASRMSSMDWKAVSAEPGGLVNIGKHRKKISQRAAQVTRNPKDVVYARTVIKSDRDRVAKLHFGYSDEVTVFLNRRPLFSGKSAFRERDPGFLGIVGVENDAVYLPLKKGDNELIFAVSEIFGGWGFIAKLEE